MLHDGLIVNRDGVKGLYDEVRLFISPLWYIWL